MTHTDVYEDDLRWESNSMIAGKIEGTIRYDDPNVIDSPILKAFIDDIDIQEIKVCSTNIGFVGSYTKQFKSR